MYADGGETMPEVQPEISLARFMPPLMRYATQLTRNSETAQDLVQDTLMHALRHKDRLAQAEHPQRYLVVMLRNLNASQHRKSSAEPIKLQSDEVVIPSSDAPAPALQTCREILEAMRSLPEPFGEILLLCAYEGLSYREIADRLHIPLGTVMSRLHRARLALRQVMKLDEDELVCDIFAV